MKQFFNAKAWVGLVIGLLIPVLGYSQGVTTSVMNGQITSADGQPLVGATVIAKHTPSGSTYGNLTNEEGFFRIPNMRVGGPYRVTVSYTGFEDFVREDIRLGLGESYRYNVKLQETAYQIDVVEVSADRNDVFDAGRTGQSTVVDARTIQDIQHQKHHCD